MPASANGLEEHMMLRPSKSVLIVEDDYDVREAVAELLQDEGYRCLHANNGLEALAALNLQKPDLLIVDLIMPVMNGPDLVDRLRQDPSHRQLPIIVMTAANDRMVGVKLDMPILHKPIEVEVFRKMLARYCPLERSAEGTAAGPILKASRGECR
jgi:CheY-like chemotaxis protein